MSYPEQINLPFNFASVKSCFILRHQSAEACRCDSGYWIAVQGNSIVVQSGVDEIRAVPEGAVPEWLVAQQEPIVIGSWQGKPLCVFSISADQQVQAPYLLDTLNATNNELDIQTLTLGGIAKQVLHWLERSRFCACCGAETGPIGGTWGRRCSNCRAEHFPHIHPCAIILVRRGNQVLLTRKAEWIAGRYSLVAGFVDFGESLEECAIREVREETGIEIANVRYVGSQNWPFPAQLMAGFVADYAGGEIVVDRNELEDARWFNVDDLPVMPPSRSIARWIIDTYAAMP